MTGRPSLLAVLNFDTAVRDVVRTRRSRTLQYPTDMYQTVDAMMHKASTSDFSLYVGIWHQQCVREKTKPKMAMPAHGPHLRNGTYFTSAPENVLTTPSLTPKSITMPFWHMFVIMLADLANRLRKGNAVVGGPAGPGRGLTTFSATKFFTILCYWMRDF